MEGAALIPVEICTVFTPQENHVSWRDDYIRLIMLQQASARRVGYSHVVVSDVELGGGLDTMLVRLPKELMRAMIVGCIERLRRPVEGHLVLVDVDCLVEQDLRSVFDRTGPGHGPFNLGLTFRDNARAPINNGVMYVHHDGVARARRFFEQALEVCGTHWGADQEAISQVASPVVNWERNAERAGCTVRFFSSKRFASVPKQHLARHTDSFMVHFKGETKVWMEDYARKFLGISIGATDGTR
jgi:hypothetical protein